MQVKHQIQAICKYDGGIFVSYHVHSENKDRQAWDRSVHSDQIAACSQRLYYLPVVQKKLRKIKIIR